MYYFVTNLIGIAGVLSNSIYDSVYSYRYPCDQIPTDEEELRFMTWLTISLTMIISVIGISCLFGTATFIHLFYLMWKRHNFEFKRSKNMMLAIFFIMSGLIAMVTYELANDINVGLQIDFSIWITKRKEEEFQKLEIYMCWIL